MKAHLLDRCSLRVYSRASASGDVDIYSASGKRLRLAVKTIRRYPCAKRGDKDMIKAQERSLADMAGNCACN